jgi:hypothetical protein
VIYLYDIIIERVSQLAKAKGEKPTVSMRAAEVGKDFFANIRKGYKPTFEKISRLADYFNVQTDYILGRSDTPNPLEIPEVLQGVPSAFHRGEFEGLTQSEVDSLARIATEYKTMREKREHGPRVN